MKLLATIVLALGLAGGATGQVATTPAPTPAPSPVAAPALPALPTHVLFVGGGIDQSKTPQGIVDLGMGTQVSNQLYATLLTEWSPSHKGIITSSRAGLQDIVYRQGNLILFVTGDAGASLQNNAVAASWSGGGGLAFNPFKAKPNVFAYAHARVIDSPVQGAADRKALVLTMGFIFGGN